MTITSATVGPVITDALHYRGLDGFWIVLPAADVTGPWKPAPMSG